jgi:hypothetical protein
VRACGVEIRLHLAEVDVEKTERRRAVDERKNTALARDCRATGSTSPTVLVRWVKASTFVRGVIARVAASTK